MKVCFVAAVDSTVKVFLVDHIKAISQFFSVDIAVNTPNKSFLKPFDVDVPVVQIGIKREISIFSDAKTVIELYALFRRKRYDIVHSVTPKAGLLSMIAGYLANVPVRIHIFTGQVWVTRKGLSRWFLKTLDRILVLCATHILVDSRSQRDFLIEQGIVSNKKSSVLADGSICGVDTDKFSPNVEARKRIRKEYGISESDVVFLYLGRLNRDKGLLDLAHSFNEVCSKYDNTHLVIVGPDEQGVGEEVESICASCKQKVHIAGYTDVPEQYFASADVFCLPSYREGFGVVIIQAASAGIPSIGTKIYGVVDTIEDGKTGLLYHPRDVDGLTSKMIEMIKRPDLRKMMGTNARIRASEKFSKGIATKALVDYYKSLLLAGN
ncbi:MAG TPA: glycosyltransferase family 4 protein [Syntrophorhabdaceae bacterium]|nr:glycosyltransferase family 4 protein [Syntrophorhabdaceae bacterium]HOS60087.1 glycosyltransferase family 4 protein [Syntrophorhabdaceae bacterium]HPN98439.1 glycosyltransferase family 4 protein [Syntrophorhabdaceae bacterium]HQI55683.1 glycosyltransferase family 4 protein [Syntrophorhabdaceae bacterium]